MIITHKICMDLTQRMLQPPIQVMQDDQYSRELEFLLTANGEPWEIPEDFSAMIRWHRDSDKVGGSYDLLPDGSLAYSKRENVLTVQLLPQICGNPGQVYLTVMMASSNAVAHTFSVTINVCKNPGLQESVPAPEPDTYQQILREYGMMSARVNNLASLEEGSTTGDAELIDGRMDHAGQVHTNIGSHIRKIGGIANDLYGTKTVTISRAGGVAAEPVAMYATVLEVVGAARYLEKVRVPVQVTGQYSSIYAAIASTENIYQPIVRKDVEIPSSGQTLVELEVGRWFSPGEKIVVEISDVEGFQSLLLPTPQEEIASDWLQDCPGSIGDLNEDTGDDLFDREDVKFVGELIFYDTLREEVRQLQEKSVDDQGALALVNAAGDGVILETNYEGNMPCVDMCGSRGDEAVRLGNIETPVFASDAANKWYVDDAVARKTHEMIGNISTEEVEIKAEALANRLGYDSTVGNQVTMQTNASWCHAEVDVSGRTQVRVNGYAPKNDYPSCVVVTDKNGIVLGSYVEANPNANQWYKITIDLPKDAAMLYVSGYTGNDGGATFLNSTKIWLYGYLPLQKQIDEVREKADAAQPLLFMSTAEFNTMTTDNMNVPNAIALY